MNDLPTWIIYDHPSDCPDCFVARKHVVFGGMPPSIGLSKAPSETITADTLEALRKKLPGGLGRISRATADDPAIVETWL
jgi:hypothetical protein